MKSRALPILAAVLACVALHPVAAVAHAFLKTASPAVGSTLASPPVSVRITFTESVEPSFSSIVVTDAAGHRVDDGKPAHLDGGDTSLLAVGLGTLQPGTYKVAWHAVATDTHRTQGTYRFTVASSTAP